MIQLADEPARALGLCLIAPDRPGYGLSTARRYRRLEDWAADLAVLMNALGHERFALVGISGGGPFALAAAHALRGRVRRLALVSSLAPLDQKAVRRHLDPGQRVMIGAARCGSHLLQAMLKLGGAGWRRLPDAVLRRLIRLALGSRHRLNNLPVAQKSVSNSFREAFRDGSEGVGNDLSLFRQAWGFDVEDIKTPTDLWHGEADAIVPVGMGRYLADCLPDCQATFIPEGGHYWIIEHAGTVLAALRERLVEAHDDGTPKNATGVP
jgi:pimeloyl-ACP methyl ester carboxylesterase